MRSLMFSLLTFAVCFLRALATMHVPQPKMATVLLSVRDSFGHQESSCNLQEFVLLDEHKNIDYKERFDGLIGRNIPYGTTYRLHVKCADDRSGGSFLVSVSRPNQFIVLSSWRNIGDYVTRPVPRLAVLISADSARQLSPQAWVKLVGVYRDRNEIDRIDPQSHTASFYDVVPGRYLILLIDGEKLACTKQIDFLESPAHLELSLSKEGCKAESFSSVQTIN